MNSDKTNWDVLAGLRFFLALVVMTGHLSQQFENTPVYLKPLVPFGTFTAVIGFLLVSGYSICHSYQQSPQGFYQRRFDRIYPSFLACYLLSLVPLTFGALWPDRGIVEPPTSMFQVIANALPVQTILVRPLMSNNATWSLGVECAFYALAPLLARLSTRRLLVLVAVSAVVHLTANYWGILPYHKGNTPLIAVALMWAWLSGWLIYIHRENIWLQRLAPAIIVAVYGFNQATMECFSLLTVSGSILILLYQYRIPLSARVAKTMRYLGDLSYPLYLVHLPTFFTLKILYPTVHPVVPFGCALLASMLIFHCVDYPLRRRAKKKAQSRTSSKIMSQMV